MRRFVVTGYRDYRVPYEVAVLADCEEDVTDERVGVEIAEATAAQPGVAPEDWERAEVIEERIESVRIAEEG